MASFRIEIRLRNVSLSEPLRQFVEQELQTGLAQWAEFLWARKLLRRLKERARRLVGKAPPPASTEAAKP